MHDFFDYFQADDGKRPLQSPRALHMVSSHQFKAQNFKVRVTNPILSACLVLKIYLKLQRLGPCSRLKIYRRGNEIRRLEEAQRSTDNVPTLSKHLLTRSRSDWNRNSSNALCDSPAGEGSGGDVPERVMRTPARVIAHARMHAHARACHCANAHAACARSAVRLPQKCTRRGVPVVAAFVKLA